jgi:hypothetical protein
MVDLHKIVLTKEMLSAWSVLANIVGSAIAEAGISPDEIPDEQAKIESDGSLLIYVDLPQNIGKVSLRVPPEHWRHVQ